VSCVGIQTMNSGLSRPRPDPTAENSSFELECFKHLLNVTA
jgi:hypothetical protein